MTHWRRRAGRPLCWAAAALLAIGLLLHAATSGKPRRIALRAGSTETSELSLESGHYYGLLISAPKLSAFGQNDSVAAGVALPGGRKVEKRLHAGDPDWYMTVRADAAGKAAVTLVSTGYAGDVDVALTPMKSGVATGVQIASGGHTTWQTAEPIELGRTVYASGDDRPYIPKPGAGPETFDQMMAGVHWYRVDYRGPEEKLVHFNVDVQDRDVPVDLAVFRLENGKPAEYTRGRERFEPERSTNFHGMYKFAPRVLSAGTYLIRVMGNHPFYQLQSDVYAAPPYTDPRQAVRTAMDYIVRKGDSWHSNTPRKGSVVQRTSNPLQETRLCIACHPTHFSTRSELIAVENGYPVRARSSLQFLVERLYNNPRPIYGKTEASWARMIHAPGNVLSRVAYITDKFDRQFAPGERREELYRGIASYLEMYWPGMTEPSHESNGNLPRISGYEVALHNALLFEDLHRRTGEAKYGDLRRQIEQVVVAGKIDDNLDLAWKIDALAALGGGRYKAEVARLVEEAFSRQQPDGTWAMPFDMEEVQYNFQTQKVTRRKLPPLPGQEGPRSSDIQTYHMIYALARAGVTLEDPRLKKAVYLCLSRQTPSGAWQGRPDYKNFDTPFRDTQYAIMALSTLFPGPKGAGGAKGWNAGFAAPPANFDGDNPAAAVGALDQHWDHPGEETAGKIRKLLASPHVLVRYQAAVALGRMADAGALEPLANRLGDSSKLVERAAAWAVRQIASRRQTARPAVIATLRAAMNSADERTRWGAVRVFNQHFKYLSEEWELGRELLRLARQEPVPAVKMGAIQALYQWWYWDRSVEHKAAIEETMLAGLGEDEHPWVRRNLIETYYLVLDDNVRYLYGSWLPRLKRPEDRAAIRDAHQESVRLQAIRYRDAMKAGNTMTRHGLLRALHTHHVREGLGDVASLAGAPVPETVAGPWVNGYKWAALYDPLSGGSGAQTSIGNDSEPPSFYADSSPLMNEALLAALSNDSPELLIETLRTLRFLRPFSIGAPLAERILARMEKAPADAVAVAKTVLVEAPLYDPAVVGRLAALIREGDAGGVEVAAALLGDRRHRKLGQEAGIQQAAGERLARVSSPDDRALPHVIALLNWMPVLRQDPSVMTKALTGLSGRRAPPQQAALRLVLGDIAVLNRPETRAQYEGYPEKRGSITIGGALTVLASLDFADARYKAAVPEIRRIILAGLNDPVHTIRAQALNTLPAVEALHGDTEIRARVTQLRRDPEAAVRNAALAFDSARELRAGGRNRNAADLLDYFYFKEKIEPILIAKGSDGQACAACHANHTILKLIEADEFGVLTLAQSRSNYNAVLAMVNLKDPENSLLLNKPVSPLDDAGVGDSQALSHGGGLRWTDKRTSKEYQAILQWIRGARLESKSDD